MNVEDPADFLDDFALDVTTPSGAVLKGIFTDASTTDPHGEPMVILATADVIAQELTIAKVISLVRPLTGVRESYTIDGRQHDGTGFSECLLKLVTS